MKSKRRDQFSKSRRLAGAVGAAATGLGGIQPSEAAVVFTPVDESIPATTTDYRVDLNADGVSEFDIQQFTTVTKVADFTIGDPNPMPTSMAAVVMDPVDSRTANLAVGTIIGPDSNWGPSGATPTGGDPLNGTINHDNDPNTPNVPAGHFQVSNGPGFIGVRFLIGANTHYGYVGYEGTGAENDASGHIFALGFEDVPDTAIMGGAGIPVGDADFDGDADVDGEDFLIWQRGLGLTGQTNNANGDADGSGTIDGLDLELWKGQFGGGAGVGAIGAVPEPTSLALLAAGAAGLALYRKRRSV